MGPHATAGSDKGKGEGRMKISKEVVQQVANQALLGVIGVRAADAEGEEKEAVTVEVKGGPVPSIKVDTRVKIKCGLPIPDIAWYIQESIRRGLEQNTGYVVDEVNVFVKGLYSE